MAIHVSIAPVWTIRQADGDALVLDEVKFKDTEEGKRRLVANKAKAARKDRKGERRGRGAPPPPRGKR